MAHEHNVIDKDTHFVIDPTTMAITCASAVKPLKRGDHRAEKYSFSMPRYIEGHDMSLCNKVEVHYNNIQYDLTTRETTTNKSFDEVEDFGISETSEDTVVWTWDVKGDATQLDGTLNFCIRFACMNGEEIEYQKFSEVYSSIPVGATIWNTDEVAKAHADVLEAWRDEIITEAIPNAVNEAMQKAKESGEFNGADGKPGADGKDGVSVTHEWEGTVLKITSASGTSSADLKGADGVIGKDGKTAYEYAKDGGYTGTEEEFAAKMAQEIPDVAQSDWNAAEGEPGHVLNRIAYHDKATYTFDGDLTDRDYIPLGGGSYYVKMSDTVPTMEQLVGATAVEHYDGTDKEYTLSADNIADGSAYGYPMYSISVGNRSQFAVALEAIVMGDITMSPGLYFSHEDGTNGVVTYGKSMTFEALKTIEPELLPSSVPVVQTATHGQMLLVKAVDENSKPTEWETVDRTHYTETGIGVVLEETSPVPLGGGQFLIDSVLPIIAGKEYTVTYNGTEYTCVCQEFTDNGTPGLLVGNTVMIGGDDTGEPFAIAALSAQGASMVVDLAGAESCTVKIVGEIETVHKLDEKYLPNNLGNVIVVSFKIDTENNRTVSTLTTDEIVSAVRKGKAVMFAETIDGEYVLPLSCCVNTGEGYTAQFDSLYRDKDSGAWFYHSVFIDIDGTLTFDNGNIALS